MGEGTMSPPLSRWPRFVSAGLVLIAVLAVLGRTALQKGSAGLVLIAVLAVLDRTALQRQCGGSFADCRWRYCKGAAADYCKVTRHRTGATILNIT
jgi:hypothetical protein